MCIILTCNQDIEIVCIFHNKYFENLHACYIYTISDIIKLFKHQRPLNS